MMMQEHMLDNPAVAAAMGNPSQYPVVHPNHQYEHAAAAAAHIATAANGRMTPPPPPAHEVVHAHAPWLEDTEVIAAAGVAHLHRGGGGEMPPRPENSDAVVNGGGLPPGMHLPRPLSQNNGEILRDFLPQQHSPTNLTEVTSSVGDTPNGGGGNNNKKSSSRRNAWGNLSYADLITQAIQSTPEKRLTLSQVYEWMVQNIPYFKDKGDSNSSAGWKVNRKIAD